ncbi:MAG: glycoside hydrolase family 140 protein [Cyclobacteriaceae bacterium]|nr:glycoside hydrolase family 140 protein [Cyclobacteriaceae bacterium]
MNKIIRITAILFCLISLNGLMAQQLKISEDGRFMIRQDGKPFFFLGDTAWELFHRLNREEADLYLSNRADKGFTVIQTVVLAELDGLIDPNPYGQVPLKDLDPARPNEDYFSHVDYIVNKAAALGLMIGMLPTWGDKFNIKWGKGPEIFNPEKAFEFGKFLGKRYKDAPIIWILGGDRNPDEDEDFQIIRQMARGLKEGDGGNHLMTFHPQGGENSSTWFHSDDWLDFNFFQSGHGPRDGENYEHTLKNRALSPVKPTMDGEPRYEDHPVRFKPLEYGWFDDFDVRQAGYWSMFSGSCGHTYGNHNIWQMWQEGRTPVSWARTNWKRAMDHSGAFQVGYMKDFFMLFPWQEMKPDQSLILNFNPRNGEYQMAMISGQNDLLFAYTPYGKPIKPDLSRLTPGQLTAYWFNPRDGRFLKIGEFENSYTGEFSPHSMGRGSDWVLVVHDRAKKFHEQPLY